jgi:hypothetical protein
MRERFYCSHLHYMAWNRSLLTRLEAHLREDLERLFVCVQQRLDPRPLRHQRLVLEQQVFKQVGLVQRRDEPLLDGLAREVDLHTASTFCVDNGQRPHSPEDA